MDLKNIKLQKYPANLQNRKTCNYYRIPPPQPPVILQLFLAPQLPENLISLKKTFFILRVKYCFMLHYILWHFLLYKCKTKLYCIILYCIITVLYHHHTVFDSKSCGKFSYNIGSYFHHIH